MGKNKKNKPRPWLKFKTNREVDKNWLHVPAKYMFNIKGSNNSKDMLNGKEFCIIEFYGNKALCGWRNGDTCKVGRTFLCDLAVRNKKRGIIYKNKFYPFDRYGWVW